jgi:hypothetical protein
MKCYNCGEFGHIAKGCPHLIKEEEEEEEEEPPMAGLPLACCSVKKPQESLFEFYEVCLDIGSQFNIVDLRLVNNLCTSSKTFRSMNRISMTECIGYLDGFFLVPRM